VCGAYACSARDVVDAIAWARRHRVPMRARSGGHATALSPFTVGAYVNYVDSDIDDWPTAYYDHNFRQLTRVKRAWDPDDVFHFAQSIPPA
jgi:FAD/FMN-containing dehydrogenase